MLEEPNVVYDGRDSNVDLLPTPPNACLFSAFLNFPLSLNILSIRPTSSVDPGAIVL